MPPSSPPPPPDRFQREIDDIVRLAEKRLERQSLGGRLKRTTQKAQSSRVAARMPKVPSAETLAGWGLALLMVSWLFGLLGRFIPGGDYIGFFCQVVGVAALAIAIILSLTRRKTGVGFGSDGDNKMWRGERVSYGNPYGESIGDRIKRMFGGRR